MRANPANIPVRVPGEGAGTTSDRPGQAGGSHAVYKTCWPGDPRVNIQDDHGKAKAYQARQVLAAIDKKEAAQ